MNRFPILLILLLSASSQQIVDYSHTASIQKSELDSNKKYDISIFAKELKADLFDFPQACARNRDLQTTEIVPRDGGALVNQEERLSKLKANMTAFLRLAERIKTHRAYLAEQARALSPSSEAHPVEEDKLEELRECESGLVTINGTISEKVSKLSELIYSEIHRTKDSGFNELRLNFELTSFEARLRFLQELKRKKGRESKEADYPYQIDEYFRENQNLKRLNELLQNFAEHSALKLKITNEMKKLQAKNHIINNKEECRLKNIKPINDQNLKHIEQITHKLRLLKKMESSNREHCEGVAVKLLNQIKKVLKAYNYSHTCSEGLDGLNIEKKEIEDNVRSLQEKLNSMQYDPTFKKIQGYFNQTRSQKEQLIQKIQTFDLNSYSVNPAIIEEEIAELKDKLRTIRYQLEHPPEGNIPPFDHEQIKERVSDINQLQHKYCALKDQYEEKYRAVEKALRRYEFRVGQTIAQNQEYLRKTNQLRLMEKEFNQLRAYLLFAIE